jgi:hypothetical protein
MLSAELGFPCGTARRRAYVTLSDGLGFPCSTTLPDDALASC